MKKTQYFVAAVCIALFLFSINSVLANTHSDDSNDVFHYNFVNGIWGWETHANRPNIDIIQVSFMVLKDRIEFKLEVAGTIQPNENIVYWIIFNSTDSSYWLSWSAGNGSGVGLVYDGSSYAMDTQPNITVSANELIGSFTILGDTAAVAFYGYAVEYTETAEWWADYAPDIYFPNINDINDNGGDNESSDNELVDDSEDTTQDENNGTPGFEAIICVLAIIASFVLIRRKRY